MIYHAKVQILTRRQYKYVSYESLKVRFLDRDIGQDDVISEGVPNENG